MIKCKKCGKVNTEYSLVCKHCSEEIEISEAEVAELLREVDVCLDRNDFSRVVDIHKMLAEAGIIEYVSQFGTAPIANGFKFQNVDQIRNHVHAA